MRLRTRFFITMLAGGIGFNGHAAVTLTTSTTTWNVREHTVAASGQLTSCNYNRTVTRTFATIILENEYLKLTLVPEYGGRITSMIYKPTGHEQLYQNPCGYPYGQGNKSFYYDWLIVYAGIFPTFSEPEHGKYYLRPWAYEIVKQSADTISIKMTQKDSVDAPFKPERFNNGRTETECDFMVTLISGKTSVRLDCTMRNTRNSPQRYEYWTCTTLSPGSTPGDPRTDENSEMIVPVDKVYIPADWGAIRRREQGTGETNVFWLNNLRQWKNWDDMGIAYAWPQVRANFWGVINQGNKEGIIRVCDNDVTLGLKIWSWAYAASVNGSDPMNLPYIELWAGHSPRFFDDATLAAREERSWVEYFTPSLGMDSISHASQHALADLKINKRSFDGTVDDEARIECRIFSFEPDVSLDLELAFEGGGSRHLVRRETLVPDAARGNVVNVVYAIDQVYNGCTALTLSLATRTGEERLVASLPVTFTNCSNQAVASIHPLRIGPASNRTAVDGRIYSLDGRCLGSVADMQALRHMQLPRGVYCVRGLRGEVKKISLPLR